MDDSIGFRVGDVIKTLGMKKVRFAERVGVDQSYMTKLTKGVGRPSELLIAAICREFNVNEDWLRTGEGEMFIRRSKSDEITSFIGNILQGEPDFRTRLISVLARMTPDEWDLLERKTHELMDELKKADP